MTRGDKLALNAMAEEFAAVHPTDEDLENYHLGTIREGYKLPGMEKHLRTCPNCVERSKQVEERIKAIRARLNWPSKK